jgi:hypothetical protein
MFTSERALAVYACIVCLRSDLELQINLLFYCLHIHPYETIVNGALAQVHLTSQLLNSQTHGNNVLTNSSTSKVTEEQCQSNHCDRQAFTLLTLKIYDSRNTQFDIQLSQPARHWLWQSAIEAIDMNVTMYTNIH